MSKLASSQPACCRSFAPRPALDFRRCPVVTEQGHDKCSVSNEK